MRYLWLILICLFAVSCAALSPENQAKLNRLSAESQALAERIEETARFVSEKKARVLEVIEKGKAGELTGIEVASLLAELVPAVQEGEEKLTGLVKKYETVKNEITDLSASGVAWWQIALYIVLGVWGTASTKGYFGAARKYASAASYADMALSGIRAVTGALESSYHAAPAGSKEEATLKAVKVEVKKSSNPIVEKEVKNYPSKAKPITV